MGSDNDLSIEQVKQDAIWTNDGLVHSRIYALLGLDELKPITICQDSTPTTITHV